MHITSPSKQDVKAWTVCSTNFSKCFSCRQIFNFRLFCANGYFSNSRCASWYLIEFWPTLWRFFTWFAISALLAFRDISARSPHERKPFCLWRAKVVPLLLSADKGGQAGGGGFPQAIMSMIPGYSSNRKQKETGPKELLSCSVPRLLTNPQLEILVKALVLIPRGARSVLLHPRGSNPCPHTLQVSGLPAELVLTW